MNAVSHTRTYMSPDVQTTHRIGHIIGSCLGEGDVVLLNGDLGSGKTCLTQGIARGLGSEDNVRSPTFVIVAEYSGLIPIYHIDLYRLEKIGSIDNLYLEEYLYGEGVSIIEWPDRIQDSFPLGSFSVRLEKVDQTTRAIQVTVPKTKNNLLIRNLNIELPFRS
ncbi:MAG: tRNA (adenosine(37)-N6)-threonylcarbamoyltransferase complex ATPase subunit type 1 TsaE [SAR202 cluster bacterium]|nr:tRNA (adenosine(37)-N6)-threonylcarbamoyltransferase complex ATPase subunit type 1 TsaE [SAR202 cluster bacterium]